jgi:hypothetical protein
MEEEIMNSLNNFAKISKNLNINNQSHRTNQTLNSSIKISQTTNPKTPNKSNNQTISACISFGERLYRKSQAQNEVKENKSKFEKEKQLTDYKQKFAFKPNMEPNLSSLRVCIKY